MRYLFVALLVSIAHAADNTIMIDQIGSNNTYVIEQKDSAGHSVIISAGKVSDVDFTTVSILQQGTGAKTATVDIKSGSNQGISMLQDGAGNHTASIQNLTGGGNNISISQTGSGTHTFNLINTPNTTNVGNTVTGIQSGDSLASKQFNLNLNGTVGATVNIQQTGTTPDSGSMNVQCNTGCGTWSYIKQ